MMVSKIVHRLALIAVVGCGCLHAACEPEPKVVVGKVPESDDDAEDDSSETPDDSSDTPDDSLDTPDAGKSAVEEPDDDHKPED